MKRKDLSDCVIAFTGKLETLTRTEATFLVRALKGKTTPSISKEVTHLVVGSYMISLFDETPFTKKEKIAIEMKNNLSSISIINEYQFLELIEKVILQKKLSV